MIYMLLKSYVSQYHLANLFHYITFRSILAVIFSFLFSTILGRKFINFLKKWKEAGQPIRDLGPESHKAKAGTPTMGGLLILASITISTLLFCDLTNPYIYIILFVLISFGILGFIDDYLKVIKKDHHGLSPKLKLFGQLVISIPAIIITIMISQKSGTLLSIPFFKDFIIDLGIFYIPFATIVIIGSSNAVNLTDGLDGLAIVPICIVTGCFAIISYLVGNISYSHYLQLIYIPSAGEITVLCSAIIGAGMGFLWFNAQPAEVFMGDTGSIALGGVLGIISVICKHEIVLAIAGGLFVIETLSVIIQVYYFKTSGGKRFFKMAPIHHHFEKSGWSESKVVIRFWIISIIFALIALSSLKLR